MRKHGWWLVVVALLIGACESVPITGRKQLILVSEEQELQLGLNEFQKLKQNMPISDNSSANAQLQRVGQRIAAVAPLPNARWEFVLFKDDSANAFALPGGKVGVFTGLLPITRDEGGLATVIGHEVAHAVARHGAERISQGLALELGGQVLATATQTQPARTQQVVSAAYGLGSQVGVMLPHSREQELEADRLGLIYMARAGYDPRQALDFWTRFSAYIDQQGGKAPEFLSTHPLSQKRIDALKQYMPAAMAEYNKAKRR